jgi:hypothetical protein
VATRYVVGMRDVIAELRAFPADIAYLCHDFAPNFGVSCRRDLPPSSAGDIALNPSFLPGRPWWRVQTHAISGLPNLQYTPSGSGTQQNCGKPRPRGKIQGVDGTCIQERMQQVSPRLRGVGKLASWRMA